MPTLVFGNNTGDDYSGTLDTIMFSGNPTLNDGSGTNLELTNWGGAADSKHLLIAFPQLSNLPAGATITSATLSLYQYSHYYEGGGSAKTFELRELLRTFVEAQATWNIYSTGNSWTSAGALSNGNDRSSSVLVTLLADATDSVYKAFSSAALGTAIQAGATRFRLGFTDEATALTWNWTMTSSQSTDGQRPKLTIVYTTGTSGTIANTLGGFTSSMTGTSPAVGTSAVTLANFTSAFSGTTSVTGTVSNTLPAFTGNFSGTTVPVGTMALTLGSFISAFAGTVLASEIPVFSRLYETPALNRAYSLAIFDSSWMWNPATIPVPMDPITGVISYNLGSFVGAFTSTTTVLGTMVGPLGSFTLTTPSLAFWAGCCYADTGEDGE